ncbi:MAG: hypothetical protein QOG10_6395 [Kribbellaceae bacterium]|jgi:hypothetical protein|nr:hypothetical protein [Kribbellaceae bacterium]
MVKVKRANHRIGTERPGGLSSPQLLEVHGQIGSEDLNEQDDPKADSILATVEFGMPIRVDEIAVAAMALSDDLHAATRGLPESGERRRFRRELDDAAVTFRLVAGELVSTAGDLVRMAAHEGKACGVSWGICPDHGITLMEVGDAVSCRVFGCDLEQTEVAERCAQPVAYRVVDAAGPALLACAGHAVACRVQLEGAVITLASDSLELL